MLFLSWLSDVLFTVTASLLKISILVFYLQLGMNKTHRGIVYYTIGAILVFMITYIFVIIFVCPLCFEALEFSFAEIILTTLSAMLSRLCLLGSYRNEQY